MPARRVPTLTAVLAALAVLTACQGPAMPDQPTAVQQHADLLTRPDLPTADADLQAILLEIRTRLDAELGLGDWTSFGTRVRSGCEEFPDDPDAERITSGSWGRTGPIPDLDWPRAVEILAQVTAGHGFGPPTVIVSRPGQHDARVAGPYGADIQLSSIDNASIGGRTGCHPVHPSSATPPESHR